MAQVYAVVYDENGRVLMAFKKAKGEYFHGEKTTPTTLNSAGQLVVPGGGLEFGESIADGSRREFREETGVDILKYADLVATKTFSKGAFGVGYYKVSADYEWALENDINGNILNRHNSDDELYQVGWLSHSQAVKTLKSGFSDKFVGKDDIMVLKKRSKYAFDLSWYVIAIENYPYGKQTMNL